MSKTGSVSGALGETNYSHSKSRASSQSKYCYSSCSEKKTLNVQHTQPCGFMATPLTTAIVHDRLCVVRGTHFTPFQDCHVNVDSVRTNFPIPCSLDQADMPHGPGPAEQTGRHC